ncbi:hypothetical protein H0H92_011912 [Tricholoma furcatifolium]|nr:hypothetical protein H0H92_011912 [Tricholoma furcatifolium]
MDQPSQMQSTEDTRSSKRRKTLPANALDNEHQTDNTQKRVRKRVKGLLSGLLDLMALQNVPGLPPCPPEFSEPAWTHLVFDPYCHGCAKVSVRIIDWNLRTRLYSRCAEEKLVSFDELISFPSEDSHFPLHTLLLSRPGKRGSSWVFRDELEKIREAFSSLQGKEASVAFIREKRAAISEIQKHSSLSKAWSMAQRTDKTLEIIEIRSERYEAIVEKLIALGYKEELDNMPMFESLRDHKLVRKSQRLTERVWANIRQTLVDYMDGIREMIRKRKFKELVSERKLEAIAVFRAYMIERYPHPDIMPSGLDFCDFPPVRATLQQSAEVTIDESSFTDILPLIPEMIVTWRKSLDVHLVEVMKKNASPDSNRSWRYMDSYDRHLTDKSRWNRFGEFMDPSEEGEVDRHKDDDGSGKGNDSNDTTTVSLPEEGDINPKNSVSDDAHFFNKLKLATTVFQCSECYMRPPERDIFSFDIEDFLRELRDLEQYLPGALFYPQVKGHLCLARTEARTWMQVEPGRKLDEARMQRRKWSTRPLFLNSKLGKCVAKIVIAAGLDPETTTPAELDRLGLWFACLNCHRTCGGEDKNSRYPVEMPAFPWRLAVEHYGSVHHGSSSPCWIKIAPEDLTAAIRAFESNSKSTFHQKERSSAKGRLAQIDLPTNGIWSCIHCRDTSAEVAPTSLEDITLHLQKRHEIHEGEEGRDYYKAFSALDPVSSSCRVLVGVTKEESNAAQKNNNLYFSL